MLSVCLTVWLSGTACRAGSPAASASGGTLLKFDFTDARSWPDKAAVFSAAGQTASLMAAKVGTVDIAGSTQPSAGLLFSATNAKGVGSAAFVSGKLPLRCRETNPGKLTLSFSLSASSTRPVTIRVESFDSHKNVPGDENRKSSRRLPTSISGMRLIFSR